eukprot:gene12584-26500_t
MGLKRLVIADRQKSRSFNSECGWGEQWLSLLNIQSMLSRISSKTPKYFAVADLTWGFYQSPLAQSNLRNSLHLHPKWDCINESLLNLDREISRLEEHNISWNSDKFNIGVNVIDCAGHNSNDQGLSFSSEKRQKVLDFRMPTTQKVLKRFLELGTYFREHIGNYSMMVQPLHATIPKYIPSLKRRLTWNPELESTFVEVQNAINEAQLCFFVNPLAPIYLHADACDYGIGAYLF